MFKDANPSLVILNFMPELLIRIFHKSQLFFKIEKWVLGPFFWIDLGLYAGVQPE